MIYKCIPCVCSSYVAPPPPPLGDGHGLPPASPVDLWWVWIGMNAGGWSRSLCKCCWIAWYLQGNWPSAGTKAMRGGGQCICIYTYLKILSVTSPSSPCRLPCACGWWPGAENHSMKWFEGVETHAKHLHICIYIMYSKLIYIII